MLLLGVKLLFLRSRDVIPGEAKLLFLPPVPPSSDKNILIILIRITVRNLHSSSWANKSSR